MSERITTTPAEEPRKVARSLALQANMLLSVLQGILFAIDDITGEYRGLDVVRQHIEPMHKDIDRLGNELCPWEEA